MQKFHLQLQSNAKQFWWHPVLANAEQFWWHPVLANAEQFW